MRCIPTSCEPVKTMPSIPGPTMSSRDTVSLPPVTKLNTPVGRSQPAMICARRAAAKGVVGDGLVTTVFPVTSAAPTGPAVSAMGKLKGDSTAQTP